MDYLKILDSTLESLKDNTETNPLPKEFVLQKVNVLNELSKRDVRLVFDKLKIDKYIDVMIIDELDQYYITFNGLLFLQRGGYIREESVKKTNLRFKKILNIILLLASIVSIAYSLTQICENFCKDEKTEKTTIINQNINKP